MNLKKSWHPLTKRNLEIVWQLEQEQNKEKQKLEQLRKEKSIENQISEINEASGNPTPRKKGAKCLEWMYNSASTLSQGHTRIPTLQQDVKQVSNEESKNTSKVNSSRNPRDDPLFKMKSMPTGGRKDG